MDPAPPPVTVSIPGRGAVPAEVLDAGPRRRERTPLPPLARGLVLSAVLLLLAAFAVAQGRSGAPPPQPAPAALPDTGVDGVSAQVSLGAPSPDARFVTRITVSVALRPSDGRGDGGGGPQPGDVTLLDVTARGFAVDVGGRAPPLVLGGLGRTSTTRTVVTLSADVVVTDCAVDFGAPRRVDLHVRRGDGPVGHLAADVAPDVVRALDRLVSRTCRRPRG